VLLCPTNGMSLLGFPYGNQKTPIKQDNKKKRDTKKVNIRGSQVYQ